MRYAFLTAILALAVAGCATPSNDAPPAADHPANPDATGPTMHHHATPAASQRTASEYQCPMHTDQTADRPAKCPICGMAMTPVPGAHDAHH